jgi:hypothetical protein
MHIMALWVYNMGSHSGNTMEIMANQSARARWLDAFDDFYRVPALRCDITSYEASQSQR